MVCVVRESATDRAEEEVQLIVNIIEGDAKNLVYVCIYMYN
jgi:hypothetical protein